jgi:hypothetical protein
VPLPAARQTPNLDENRGFRAFQLPTQEAPASEATLANPTAEGGTMGEKMVEKFCRKWRLPRHFWGLSRAVKHNMGQTALLPLRRKAC